MDDFQLTTGGKGGGYWYGSFVTREGKRKRFSLGNIKKINKTQATKKLIHLMESGAYQNKKKLSVSQWLEQYLKFHPLYSEGTANIYRQAVKYLIDQAGDIPINEINKNHAASYPTNLIINRNLKPVTAHKHSRTIRSLFNHAVEQEIILKNPFDKIIKIGKHEPKFVPISLNEFQKLIHNSPSQSWRNMIGLTRLAGLRLGEAMRLKWEDVDLQKNILKVQSNKENQTTKDRSRIVPIVPDLKKIIQENNQRSGVKLTDFSMASFQGSTAKGYRDMDKIIQKSDLERWPKPFHTLRKSCESDWLSQYPVMDVTKWMGHSPSVASQHYHTTTPEIMSKVTGNIECDQKDKEIQRLQNEIDRLKDGYR